MSDTYLIHSAKGTSWRNHKYLRIENGKYIYSDEKVSQKTIDSQVKKTMSGAYGTGSSLRKALGKNYGIVTSSAASKFKKPGKSGSSTKKSSSKTSTKSSSTTTKNSTNSSSKSSSSKSSTKTTAIKSVEAAKAENTIPKLKDVLNSILTLGENDSYFATQNDNGSTSVTVEYEDGSTQLITLNDQNEVVHLGEKEKKQLSHYTCQGENYLMHYGLAGMHWGKRRWQYEDGRFNEEGKIRYFGYPKERDEKEDAPSKNKSSNSTSASNHHKGKIHTSDKLVLSDSQKKAIKIGAAAAAVALVAVGGYALYRSGALDGTIQKIVKNPNKFADGSDNLLSEYGIKLIPGASTTKNFSEDISDTLHWANKNARGITQGRNHNCVSCAFATELRQRGYDVSAKENLGHYKPAELMKVFGKPDRFKGTNETELYESLLSHGEGARGIMMGSFNDTSAGAHFFNWEIKNGKINFLDGQQNMLYEDATRYTFFGDDSLYNITKTMIFRTDDKQFNAGAIANFVEANDYKHFTFSNKTLDKWLNNGIPRSALAIEDLGNGQFRNTVRRGYTYVQGFAKNT